MGAEKFVTKLFSLALEALLLACGTWPGCAQVIVRLGPEMADQPLRPLLGVNGGPVPAGEPGNADLTSQYREIGVNLIRTHDYYGAFDMPTLYPDQEADPYSPSSYNFALSDKVYRVILDAGFEPYLRIGDSYNNVRRVTNLAHWTQAAVRVVRHYQDTSLWGRAPLRYVEIYNEPDNAHFWRGTREEFFQLFAQTARALKEAFPELKVGGPGFAPSGFLSPLGQNFARGLIAFCRSQGLPMDFLSYHVYSNEPADHAAAVAFYRNLLDANNYRTTELHLTEWNTEEPSRGDRDPNLRVGARGAAINTAAWIVLQEQEVAVSTFYRGNDTSLALPTFYGLFFADGRPKPVARAFGLWSKMCGYPRRMQVAVSDGGKLRVLAGRNRAGDLALLLANPASASASWRVEGWNGGGLIRLQEISPAVASIHSATLESLAAEIPGYSVQIVEVSAQRPPAVRAFSAASFREGEAAPGSLASVFGAGLSGASAEIRDAVANVHPVEVIYSSQGQLNLVVPEAVSLGRATLAARTASGETLEAPLDIIAVAPGLFTANADGRGVPAARLLRVLSNGLRVFEDVFRIDDATQRYVPAPLLVGEPGEETYLELYGTGIRGRSSLEAVSVRVGGIACAVMAAEAHSLWRGLDQVNVKLPAALRGAGEATLLLAAEGRAANPVTLRFR